MIKTGIDYLLSSGSSADIAKCSNKLLSLGSFIGWHCPLDRQQVTPLFRILGEGKYIEMVERSAYEGVRL